MRYMRQLECEKIEFGIDNYLLNILRAAARYFFLKHEMTYN